MNFKNLLSEYKEYSDFLAALKNKETPISVSGIVEAAWGQFIYQTAEKRALVIAYNDSEAERIAENLRFFSDRVFVFPSKEYVFFDIDGTIDRFTRMTEIQSSVDLFPANGNDYMGILTCISSHYNSSNIIFTHKNTSF